MSDRAIVSRIDKTRLDEVVGRSPQHGLAMRLRALLERARPVDPDEVPPDVVTMNTRVTVRYASGERETFTLAYPDAIVRDALSVLSPLGVALLASREGDRLAWAGSRLSRVVTVEQIEYQPEREHNFTH